MDAKRIGGRWYSENIRNVAPNGITPLVRAMPFKADPMACSRIPKWKLRPSLFSDVKESNSFKLVSVDGERSSAPPIKWGRLSAMAFNTLPDAWRVAIFLSDASKTGNLLSHPFGNLPV